MCSDLRICGEEILSILHLQEIYLIPTSHKIAGVTGKYIDILGVILAEIVYNELSSHTVIYVGKGIRGFFLSPKVQTDIGILPNGYPNNSVTLMHVISTETVAAISSSS